jgi:prevent-host-death family protein
MNRTVSISQAKPRLGDLVEQARLGQTNVITVNDEPCAQIGPVPSRSRALTSEWRERAKTIRLNRPGRKKLSIAELIRGSRR